MDKVKNITGLVEWYARSESLRKQANLLVIAGRTNPEKSSDVEEREQIRFMHSLMDQYRLDGQVRWLRTFLDKKLAGELYRHVADTRGCFVQPALFEAFGITVIEAMITGLPTFATCFGGPSEIIEHGISGFHIDPCHGDRAAAVIGEFFKRCSTDKGYWEKISKAAIQHVKDHYTWTRYAERLMTLSRVYGFWKFVSNMQQEETERYLDMFYGLQYQPLAKEVK